MIEILVFILPLTGILDQINSLKTIAIVGPNRNKNKLDVMGRTISFENSLIASLKGWGIPPNPTLLGPFRNWEYPRIFRSSSVIKATFTRTGIIIKIKFNGVKIDNQINR